MSFSRDNANTNPPTSHPLNTNTPEAQPSDNLTATTSTPTQSILLPSPDPNDPKWSSPGNAHRLNPDTPPMSTPNLSFLYRLECNVSVEEMVVGAPYGAGITRSIVNILDGSLDGPRIKGRVLPGGADWMTTVEGTHNITLDARYTILTRDNHPIYIQARGTYRPGPGTIYSQSNLSLPPPHTVTQQDVEFFSHLRLEAGGDGPYNWVNGLVCVGVMCCVGERIVIDVYYLTNFLGREPDSVIAVR